MTAAGRNGGTPRLYDMSPGQRLGWRIVLQLDAGRLLVLQDIWGLIGSESDVEFGG